MYELQVMRYYFNEYSFKHFKMSINSDLYSYWIMDARAPLRSYWYFNFHGHTVHFKMMILNLFNFVLSTFLRFHVTRIILRNFVKIDRGKNFFQWKNSIFVWHIWSATFDTSKWFRIKCRRAYNRKTIESTTMRLFRIVLGLHKLHSILFIHNHFSMVFNFQTFVCSMQCNAMRCEWQTGKSVVSHKRQIASKIFFRGKTFLKIISLFSSSSL